jgi:monofunctional biosynthetic peptidoglycan transglycosylase
MMLFRAIAVFFRVLKFAWNALWTVYQLALGVLLIALIVLFLKVADYFHIADIRSLRNHPPDTTAFIEAARRDLRDSLRHAAERGATLPDTAVRWSWIPLDSIPRTLVELILVAEDAKFYTHEGFDLEQIEYALVSNHQAGRPARGASTITQQVAKNLYLSGDKEMRRKFREAALALLLEEMLGKDRILEVYLNIAQFGRGVFGVREGALHHFGKEPLRLNPEEMLSLACLLPSPGRWSPKRYSSGYALHKRRVMQNYALFKGIKSMADSTAPDWLRGAYDSLGNRMAEQRWKSLRSGPLSPWQDSARADTGSEGATEEGSRRLF